MYTIGDHSIFKLAQEAKDRTDDAIKKEQQDLADLADKIKEEYGGIGDKLTGGNDVSTITDIVDKNTPTKDSLGNPITIPEGFKVVPDGQDGVEYTYTGDKKPTVQDGIVIEDNEGNQFVWIPVGEIKNKDNTTTTITLGRYTFADDGTPTLEQNADNYTELVTIDSNFQELESSTYGNTVAKNLENFVTNTKANRGYYLARYEASQGDDNKAKSKSAAVWNSITQPNAATAAREMYTSTNFESDLVNSYAWDTAIVFIQTYSGDNDYSKQKSKNTSLANTGANNDKVCNIHDMASNVFEWTTETCTNVYGSCTRRGGSYDNSYDYTAGRGYGARSSSRDIIGFRVTLYLK